MGDIVTRYAQASVSQQAYNFEGVNYFNNNASYFSQPHNITPSYYHSSWETYDSFSYGSPSMQSQESSSSYYQEQIRQTSGEELFLTLKEEIKMDKDVLEMQWLNEETDMERNMETKIK